MQKKLYFVRKRFDVVLSIHNFFKKIENKKLNELNKKGEKNLKTNAREREEAVDCSWRATATTLR